MRVLNGTIQVPHLCSNTWERVREVFRDRWNKPLPFVHAQKVSQVGGSKLNRETCQMIEVPLIMIFGPVMVGKKPSQLPKGGTEDPLRGRYGTRWPQRVRIYVGEHHLSKKSFPPRETVKSPQTSDFRGGNNNVFRQKKIVKDFSPKRFQLQVLAKKLKWADVGEKQQRMSFGTLKFSKAAMER